MAVSKRLRAEILRRDNSTCQNCGAKAPHVKLTVDHVVPVTLGGADDPSNLQTLCEPCNSGKSATPPDAATVQRVEDDAIRWAQAMESAAEHLMADRDARLAARAAFDEKWKAWGQGRVTVPRPADWAQSVDNFMRAGLPLPVLLDFVDVAMSARRVKSEDVFKYMCGAAWKEVRKLQKAARGILDDSGKDDAADGLDADEFDPEVIADQARHDLARQLMEKLSPWDRQSTFGRALEAAAPYEPTTAELETTAIRFAIEAIVEERDKLYDITMGFLHALADGEERWRAAVEELHAEGVTNFFPGDVIERAVFRALNEGAGPVDDEPSESEAP